MMLHRATLTIILFVWALVIIGCKCKIEGKKSGEKVIRERWNAHLRDGYDRSNYDWIVASHPATASIHGFRLWQGTYRNVSIALYSCVLRHTTIYEIEHRDLYPKKSEGIRYVSIILAVEKTSLPLQDIHPNYKGPPLPRVTVVPVTEKKYPSFHIDIEKNLRDPGNPRSFDIGGITVRVKDEGNGTLMFAINVLKQSKWDTFDLETVLRDYNLTGEKKIIPLPIPSYTPEQFAKAMIQKLGKFTPTSDPWWGGTPRSCEMVMVDHPMWENPVAMKVLLPTAPPKELVNAIRFMAKKIWKDSRYLTKLESITPVVLRLAKHKSTAVRGAFSGLLACSHFWPKDVRLLEPLLSSSDPEILLGVLVVFVNRQHVPSDMTRVQKLATSQNEIVRHWAESLLKQVKARGN